MKVLHVFNSLKFSGAEIMYVGAARQLQSMGCELFALATASEIGDYVGHFRDVGFQVLHRPYPSSKWKIAAKWRYLLAIRKLIRDEHIDVVHIHSAGLKCVMALTARSCGVKCIYTVHNVFRFHGYHWLTQWIERRVMRLTRCRIQTISDSVHDTETNYWHNKATLVYNWYNTPAFYLAASGERERCRQELGLPANAPVVVSVGGCSPVKRHEDALKAMTEIVRRWPEAVYLHLGAGVSTEAEKNLARKLGIEDNIRFMGNQTDVRRFLIASDVYVMPSRHEGIPITTIEAMACGIPAVLYDVPGLRDFNAGEERSRLIAEDSHKLAEAIAELYTDKTVAQRLSAAAMDFVHSRFDMATNIKQIYRLYQ